MNPVHRKTIQWIFFAITFSIFIYICYLQAERQEKIELSTIHNDVLFYYDGNYDYATSLFETNEGQYYVYLPTFADLNNIRVEIPNEKGVFISDDDTITVYKNKKNNCSFKTELEYTLVLYDDDDNELRELPVVFMKSANLATLYLSTESGTFETVDVDREYKENAAFSFVLPNGETVHSNIFAEVSARGNHTFGYEKKSYQFDLSRACDLLGMGDSKTWILLCNSYDLSNLRNKITYDLAVNTGMEGSPKSEFVDVYFNNIYHGTYLLSEKVEFGSNRIDYEDMESRNAQVNGKKLREYESFDIGDGIRKGFRLDNTPQDITGGYLIEHDYERKFDKVGSGFITDSGEMYALKNPKHASEEEVEYIAGLFQEIEDAIKSKDGYNKETGKHYSEYIDMKSWADKYIVEEFCKNHGAGCTSSYFYKLPDSVSTKVYGGPVWDYDKAYARNAGLAGLTHDLNFMTLHSSYTTLFYYLYQHDDFRELVFQEWREVFAPYIENEMIAQIDYYEEYLYPALQMNFHRFDDMYRDHVEVDTNCYREDVEKLRQFIYARKGTLDAMWTDEKEVCNVRFVDEQQELRSYAILKGDMLQIVPNHWTDSEKNLIWVDSETGEPLTVGMVVERDIVAVEREE